MREPATISTLTAGEGNRRYAAVIASDRPARSSHASPRPRAATTASLSGGAVVLVTSGVAPRMSVRAFSIPSRSCVPPQVSSSTESTPSDLRSRTVATRPHLVRTLSDSFASARTVSLRSRHAAAAAKSRPARSIASPDRRRSMTTGSRALRAFIISKAALAAAPLV